MFYLAKFTSHGGAEHGRLVILHASEGSEFPSFPFDAWVIRAEGGVSAAIVISPINKAVAEAYALAAGRHTIESDILEIRSLQRM